MNVTLQTTAKILHNNNNNNNNNNDDDDDDDERKQLVECPLNEISLISPPHIKPNELATCDWWLNGFASRLTNSCNSQKAVHFTHIMLGGQTMKNLHQLVCEFELDQSQCNGGSSSRKNTHKTHSNNNNVYSDEKPVKDNEQTNKQASKQAKKPRRQEVSLYVSPELLRHLLLLHR